MKRLSLKRPSSSKSGVYLQKTSKLESSVTAGIDKNVVSTVISSGSDNEEETKQRQSVHLDKADPSLWQLRQLVRNTVIQTDIHSLSAFPSYIPVCGKDEEKTQEKLLKQRNSFHERLQSESNLTKNVKLSPFPKLCIKCYPHKQNPSTGPSDTTFLENDGKGIDNDLYHKENLRAKTLTTKHVVNNIIHKPSDTSTADNINTKSSGVTQSNQNQDHKNRHYPSVLINTNISSSVDSPREVINASIKSAQCQMQNAQGVEKSAQGHPQSSSHYQSDNSHLMRDRNSNYYALQSRNDHGHHGNTAKNKKVAADNMPKNNSLIQSAKEIPHKKGINSPNATDQIIQPKNNLKQNSKSPCIMNNTLVQSTALTVKDRPKQANCDSMTKKTSLFKSTAPNTVSKTSLFKTITNKPISGPTTHTKSVKNISKPGTTAVISNSVTGSSSHQGSDSARSILGTQRTSHPNQNSSAGSTSNQQAKTPSKDMKEVILQSCPLCQIQFEKGAGQMDIDSHIAACLSTSEDDVMW